MMRGGIWWAEKKSHFVSTSQWKYIYEIIVIVSLRVISEGRGDETSKKGRGDEEEEKKKNKKKRESNNFWWV